jgi:hypothetical protein
LIRRFQEKAAVAKSKTMILDTACMVKNTLALASGLFASSGSMNRDLLNA